jgi:transcriptional regulator with XRE-family HTH domain
MKLERSREWWLVRARREGDAAIGAGILARDPMPDQKPVSAAANAEETRIAFGKFVNLMRRRQGLTIEGLAEEADLDVSDLLIIEDHLEYIPDPRTIYKLAQTFDVSQQRLMQLAGLAVANDAGFRQEAVRFAARSEAVQKLNLEEASALEAFIAVLSKQVPERSK